MIARLRRLGSMMVTVTGLVIVVVAVIAATLVFDPLNRLGGGAATEAEAATERDSSTITVTTLSTTVEVDGNLQPTEQRTVSATRAGTVTAAVEAGDAVEAGAALFAVDGSPTVALPGSIPAWRTMSVDDTGSDVAQLEAALVALGYDPDGALTVDDTYTTVTAAVVEAWQADADLEVTGSVEWGSMVFVPMDSRVTSVPAVAGQAVSPGEAVLELATADRELVFPVTAEHVTTIDIGDVVSLRLPDRSTFEAVVTDIAADGAGSWLVTATIEVGGVDGETGASVLPDGDQIPVTVSWSHVLAEDVTTVPAGALTRLDTGVYVVEVVEPDDTTRFVEVGIGVSSGSTIEIVTDLPPGTTIIG